MRPTLLATIIAAILLTYVNPNAFAGGAHRRHLVDINHAGIEELEKLPGIREALAEKIIRNRPYANKTQLESRGIVPAATYRRIRPLIIARH
jgi:DNA uptake protein ComE-like DNA-binding protein